MPYLSPGGRVRVCIMTNESAVLVVFPVFIFRKNGRNEEGGLLMK